jgi:4-hydroxybenzoate polyprenyltransferase
VNAHDLPEGIYDIEGDRKQGVKTYAISFGERTAAQISFAMFFISGILALLLVIIGTLTLIFYFPFLFLWIYTLYYSHRLVKADDTTMKTLSSKVGRKGFDYFLMSYNLIFLDVIVRIVLSHFNVTI